MRLTVAIAFAATACQTHVDTDDFESRIHARVDELGLPPSTVTCPKDVVAQAGARFTCAVAIAGTAYDLDVTIDNANASGAVAAVTMATHWKRGDAVVGGKLGAKLAAGMSDALGTPVTVDCGEPLRFLAADRTVRCELAAGPTRVGIITKFDGKLDPTDWKLDPPTLAKTKLELALRPLVRAQTVADATVTCGDAPLILRPANGIVRCAITAGGTSAPIAVTVDDALAVKHWQLVDAASPP